MRTFKYAREVIDLVDMPVFNNGRHDKNTRRYLVSDISGWQKPHNHWRIDWTQHTSCSHSHPLDWYAKKRLWLNISYLSLFFFLLHQDKAHHKLQMKTFKRQKKNSVVLSFQVRLIQDNNLFNYITTQCHRHCNIISPFLLFSLYEEVITIHGYFDVHILMKEQCKTLVTKEKPPNDGS